MGGLAAGSLPGPGHWDQGLAAEEGGGAQPNSQHQGLWKFKKAPEEGFTPIPPPQVGGGSGSGSLAPQISGTPIVDPKKSLVLRADT